MKQIKITPALVSLARKYNYNLAHGLDIVPTSADYAVLGEFLRNANSKEFAHDIRYLRDTLLSSKPSLGIAQVIEKILAQDNSGKAGRDAVAATKCNLNNESLYKPDTRKLHAEHLKCCGGKALKNVDLHLEKGEVSHKIRRIVEKRMAQSVHRSFKGRNHTGRCAFMKRHAVQYELGTLGIIDDLKLKHRESSTHWARVYSKHLGRKILKPKRGYSSPEKAQSAMLMHIMTCADNRPMAVYLCAHCGQYHYGHSDNPGTTA